jgi:hypothetical protein
MTVFLYNLTNYTKQIHLIEGLTPNSVQYVSYISHPLLGHYQGVSVGTAIYT